MPSSGHHKFRTAGEHLEGLRCELCILVIRRAKHNYVGFLLHCGIDAFLNRAEADVVENFITGTSEEVR